MYVFNLYIRRPFHPESFPIDQLTADLTDLLQEMVPPKHVMARLLMWGDSFPKLVVTVALGECP